MRTLLALVLCTSVVAGCSKESNPASGLVPFTGPAQTSAPGSRATPASTSPPSPLATSAASPGATSLPSPAPTPASSAMPLSGTVVQTGQIVLPAGVSIPMSSLTVVNSTGSASPNAAGAFAISAYGGPQFTMVIDRAGNPIVGGFLSASDPTLDALSTAKMLAYFGGAFYALPSPYRSQLVDAVATAPGFSPVEAAVVSALQTNGPGLTGNAGVTNALTTFITTLYAPSATSSSAAARMLQAARSHLRPSDVLVNPSTAASGITTINDFPDGIHFTNTYRRAAVAFIDQDSYVDQTNTRQPAAQNDVVPPVQISATSGLSNVSSSLASAAAGAYSGATAYTPVSTSSVPLSNLPMAKSTRFIVTVVGAGAPNAAIALRDEESKAQQFVSVQQLVQDFVVPVFASIIVPISSSQIDNALGYDGGNAALTDFVTTLTTAAPQIYSLMDSGNVSDALTLAFNTVVTSNTVQAAFLQVIQSGLGAAQGVAVSQVFYQQMSGLVNKLNVLSGALVVSDVLVVAQNIGSSNDADQFVVDVTADKVTLTPQTAMLQNGATQTFTAAVPAESGADTAGQALVWQWTNTATAGTLTDGIAGHQDDFMSSSASVTYTADPTKTGTDTVTVTAFLKQGTTMTQIGDPTSSTVTVSPSALCNGSFLQGFQCWTQTTVQPGYFSGFPKFEINTADFCLADPDQQPFYSTDVPGGAESLLTQTITVPSGAPMLSLLTWGNLDPTTVTLTATPAGGGATVLGTFTPPTIAATETTCSGNVPQQMTFDLSAFAGKNVTLGIDVTSTGGDGTLANFTHIGFSSASMTLGHARRSAIRK